jgi:hypothetical protein
LDVRDWLRAIAGTAAASQAMSREL